MKIIVIYDIRTDEEVGRTHVYSTQTESERFAWYRDHHGIERGDHYWLWESETDVQNTHHHN